MKASDVRGVFRSTVLATPAGRYAVAANGRRRKNRGLLTSGLFDQEYYEAQAGRTFGSPRAALQDYLTRGRRQGLAPNLLFEPEWHRPQDWKNRTDPLHRYRDGGAGPTGVGPLFDEAAYVQRHPASARHPGGALGHFLSTAKPGTRLPVPADHRAPAPTLGEVRELLLDRARLIARHADLRVDRRTNDWDGTADAAFVARWRSSQAPAPAADGTPAVSVLMPVRNRPVQVRRAIESVRAQTFGDWELVVVDDGSTDATADVVAEIAAQDPRIRLVRGEALGIGAARNQALALARGRRTAFLDSDLTWVPHYLEVMVRYLEAEGLRAGHAVIDTGEGADRTAPEGDTPGPPGRYLAFDGGLEHLLVKNHVDLNGLVVDTELVRAAGGFAPTMRRWVDHDLVIRLARRTGIPLVPFVGVRHGSGEPTPDQISVTESESWQWVALGRNHVDWAALAAGLGERVPGRVSMCVPTYQDWAMTRAAIDAVLRAADAAAAAGAPGADVEVVVVVNGSRRAVTSVLAALYLGEPRVVIVPVPRNLNFAIGSNLAFAHSTGETAVFLNNDTEVTEGWLPPLLEELADPQVLGAQPLLLYPDGTVQSAGTVFSGGSNGPTAFLANHPPADAERSAPIRLEVVTAAAMAMRAQDVVALEGFDPIFVNGFEDVDLCLRAVDGGERRFAVATGSVVVHHESRTPGRGLKIQVNRKIWLERWRGRLPASNLHRYEELGFEIAHLDPGPPVELGEDVRIPRPVLVRRPRVVAEGPAAGLPALRWALKLGVPAGPAGDGEPHVAFARELALALRHLGQDVVVDRREGNQRSTAYLDDVVLTLRNAVDLPSHPGRANLMWVLDPTETVPAAEAARYDAVLTADLLPPSASLDVAARTLLDAALKADAEGYWRH